MMVESSATLASPHDGGESRQDGFPLAMTDTSQSSAAVYRRSVTVAVRPVNDQPPVIARNSPATVDFGGTLVLASGQLRATDADNSPDHIAFVVSGKPRRGELQLMSNQR